MVIPQVRGLVPKIPWDRVTRTTDPRLRMPIPAMQSPRQNANVLLNKKAVVLNRGGSDEANPILAGLGVSIQITLSPEDVLTGLFIYQDQGAIGNNLLPSVTSGGPNIYLYTFMAGDGISSTGTPAAGAKRNYLLIQSKYGRVEKELWLKTFDSDIVAIQGTPVLDPTTLAPKPLTVQIVNGSDTWLQLPIDFFVSWGDEFQRANRLLNGTPENGFFKSYGGAAFVTFFDSVAHTQGVGVLVNAVTDAPIRDQHIIEIQNTPGTKLITARFRSKAGSTWFVDVPIILNVIAAPSGSCEQPVDEYCGQMYLKKNTPLPAHVQASASVPNVQDVLGTVGVPIDRDLLYISVHGAIVGPVANLFVRKWKWIQMASDISGARLNQVGSDLVFLPIRAAAATPVPGGDYGSPQMLTVCFDVAADRALNVAFYTVQIQDGHSLGPAQMFTAPHSRDISFFPAGGMGGTDPCVTY